MGVEGSWFSLQPMKAARIGFRLIKRVYRGSFVAHLERATQRTGGRVGRRFGKRTDQASRKRPVTACRPSARKCSYWPIRQVALISVNYPGKGVTECRVARW